MKYRINYIGQAASYSCGSYGQAAYNSNCQQAATSSGSTGGTSPTGVSGAGGILANTGYDVIVPLALAVSILGASAIALIKKSRHARATRIANRA